MKKVLKIAMVILILASIYLMTYSTYAASTAADIWNVAGNFLNTGADEGAGGFINLGTTDIKASFVGLVDFLWGLGLLTVFASTIILGIKYMLVSPNEKSRIKQATIPYIIGVVIIFGAVTIWKLMIAVLDGSMGIGG